jgi:hypothetical protein
MDESKKHIYDRYYDCLKAIRRFEGLSDAVDPKYQDDVIIRCEVTAGDIRELMKCLESSPELPENLT